MTQEIAVFAPITTSYQDSQIHKDLQLLVKNSIRKHVIEKEDDIEKIGKVTHIRYNPRGAVSIRKIYKRKHFSAKA